MSFTVKLCKFRVFESTDHVPIRPITLLTGGNSAGKTSFLAALRYMSDIGPFSTGGNAFNKDPFFLGAYDQIAHHRGGRYGRANEFSFSYAGPSSTELPQNRLNLAQDVDFTISFRKRLSQPSVHGVSFRNRTSSVSINFVDDWKKLYVEAYLADQRLSRSSESLRGFTPERITQSPILIAYALQEMILSDSNASEVEKSSLLSSAVTLTEMMRAAISAVPTTSFVGAPVRTRPSRTYDPTDSASRAEGSHVPSQMAQLARSNPSEWAKLRQQIASFGKASSLFSDLEIRGLGRSGSDPFQIYVTINGPRRNIMDVGYGVSQALPVIFELLRRSEGHINIIQQPEVHLHPEAQAALGSFVVADLSRMPGYIVIETHSDYLIDRIRRHVREGKIKKEDISILYFEKHEFTADIYEIKIDDGGDIVSAPDHYRDFFLREQFENIGL